MTVETKQIVAHDLYNYSIQLAEAVREGFSVSEDTEYFPRNLGTTLLVTLVKESEEEQQEEAVTGQSDTKPKRGRKTTKEE